MVQFIGSVNYLVLCRVYNLLIINNNLTKQKQNEKKTEFKGAR